MLNNKFKKLLLASSILVATCDANAGYTLDVNGTDKITFGGYIKADLRYTDGNIAAREYWIGTAGTTTEDISNVRGHVNETRFNAKYVHGDVTGFIEMDFFGTATTGGANANQQFSNSSNPRLRHAFIKYKNVLVGQTWTTFQNTSSLAEAADFGGPLVSAAFVRQSQVRYTNGGLQLSLENPETRGGTTGDDSIPDLIAKYTFKGDWGNVSVSGLARQLNSSMGNTESAIGYGIAGRINTVGKDDFRFQVHGGETGRYVGVAAASDMVGEKVEETTSVSVAYRHFWNDDVRSTAFYGNTTTEESDIDNTHWGVNVFKNYTKQLSFGLEVGNFEMDQADADSNYVQISAKYVL
jgi:hypothetical protein